MIISPIGFDKDEISLIYIVSKVLPKSIYESLKSFNNKESAELVS
jgi:hypothetical protein